MLGGGFHLFGPGLEATTLTAHGPEGRRGIMKRLVVCCDGTWQRLDQDRPTNVALAARAVAARDADGAAQIVHYSAGVGCNLDQLNLFQGAFGLGLDQNLLEAYLFLTLNYEPGDQIYLFGFSRGAYTVRSLAGLVRKCGILRRAHADKTRRALDLYRQRDVSVDSAEAVEFRNAFAIAWPKLDAKGVQSLMGGPVYDLRFNYIGVWDTVGALGVPRTLPFARGFNKKFEFHDLGLSRAALAARHAVAIDESRNAFKPTLWSNLEELNAAMGEERFQQVWFPGDHGAVGGGTLASHLSNGALLWVIEGAERMGLAFDRAPAAVLSQAMAHLNPADDPLKDKFKLFSAMALVGWSARKGVERFGDVHENARLRWARARKYRPGPLKRFRKEFNDWAKTLDKP